MHIFKFLTTFLWVTTECSINRFGPKKTGFFRSGCRLPVNLKSRQPPGCGCAENLAEKPDRTGLLNTNLIPVVSSSFCPRPLCASLIFFNSSKFSPVSKCSSVFRKVFEKAMRSVGIISQCTREVFVGYRFFLLLFYFYFAFLFDLYL